MVLQCIALLSYRVSPEFVRRVQNYIDRDLLTDVTDISKGESKLSSNHIPKLKSLVVEESVALQRLVLVILFIFISKILVGSEI